MKEQLSIKNSVHEQKPDSAAAGDLPVCEFPVKNNPGDHSDRKKKTWCSYMENGFRETRDMMKEQAPLDCNRQKNSGK